MHMVVGAMGLWYIALKEHISALCVSVCDCVYKVWYARVRVCVQCRAVACPPSTS